MKLYMKIGTMPGRVVSAPKVRKAPAVGQLIEIREEQERFSKPCTVLIDEIRDVGGQLLYVAQRM